MNAEEVASFFHCEEFAGIFFHQSLLSLGLSIPSDFNMGVYEGSHIAILAVCPQEAEGFYLAAFIALCGTPPVAGNQCSLSPPLSTFRT